MNNLKKYKSEVGKKPERAQVRARKNELEEVNQFLLHGSFALTNGLRRETQDALKLMRALQNT